MDFSTIVMQDVKKDITNSPLGTFIVWKTYSLEGVVGLYDKVLTECMDKHSPTTRNKVI